jgi:hypothetical protein
LRRDDVFLLSRFFGAAELNRPFSITTHCLSRINHLRIRLCHGIVHCGQGGIRFEHDPKLASSESSRKPFKPQYRWSGEFPFPGVASMPVMWISFRISRGAAANCPFPPIGAFWLCSVILARRPVSARDCRRVICSPAQECRFPGLAPWRRIRCRSGRLSPAQPHPGPLRRPYRIENQSLTRSHPDHQSPWPSV